jgi:NhaP-type Na+/H+ or K+/H+ antiporter
VLRQEYAVPLRLLVIGLPLTILVGALLAAVTFAHLNAAEAVMLAVLLAPTGAALGQAVVTEPRLPSRIRQGLNVESGLNDGICVPLLLVALAAADIEAKVSTTRRVAAVRRGGIAESAYASGPQRLTILVAAARATTDAPPDSGAW